MIFVATRLSNEKSKSDRNAPACSWSSARDGTPAGIDARAAAGRGAGAAAAGAGAGAAAGSCANSGSVAGAAQFAMPGAQTRIALPGSPARSARTAAVSISPGSCTPSLLTYQDFSAISDLLRLAGDEYRKPAR